eukprot:964135-Pyramimonas_sp.AAC.1
MPAVAHPLRGGGVAPPNVGGAALPDHRSLHGRRDHGRRRHRRNDPRFASLSVLRTGVEAALGSAQDNFGPDVPKRPRLHSLGRADATARLGGHAGFRPRQVSRLHARAGPRPQKT